MLEKKWPVLIVDDEPDVLDLSTMMLKDVQVDGVPLELHTASSKAEAIQLFQGSPGPPGPRFFAVGLVDVVMETDTAGLELCNHVRNQLRNSTTQLYIRTGQAGLAPERAVIDRYDINGYFTKLEAGEDKLYSMVKAGVRQHEYLTNSLILFRLLTQSVGKPIEAIRDMMRGFGGVMERNGSGVAIVIGGDVLVSLGINEAAALAEIERLGARQGNTLAANGDVCITDGSTALFKAAASGASDAASLLYTGVMPPSQTIQVLHMEFIKGLAALVTSSRRLPAGVA